ncbi:(p)ppGpp synthetase [Psychrobacter sp. FBL11]|uniref:(P)ppGpp synthetase n=1 Tax=Psychrobacter saeujeotis TaxID=3143436 RepID=A0ABU9X8K4_9GAMM|nr:(p)ppGpp synthetase [uncultured Psychrobacter sp.]
MNSILKEYDKKREILEDLDKSLKTLINSLLKQKGIKAHQIQTRVKDRDSLEKKILAKQKYKSLDDITDVVGVRIITYFEDEVNKVAKVVEEEFDIDQENSVDKREIDTDRFGYRSLHYVASLKKNRTILSEYSDFETFKFEFQIRSILQHSWAEIEHDLGYKGASEIPSSAKRTFYRVAALLEQADIEFVKLNSTIMEFEYSMREKIKTKPDKVKIDKASLLSFMTTNESLTRIEDEIGSSNCSVSIVENNTQSLISDSLIDRIKALGIENIKDLEDTYLRYEKRFVPDTQIDFESTISTTFEKGTSVLWLLIFLENMYNNNQPWSFNE